MSDYHDECFDDLNFDSQSQPTNSNIPVLLEARFGERWCPIRIAHEFPSIRIALDSLSIFARQQKVDFSDVRMKALRTEDELITAENAVIAYRHDPGR